MTPSEKAKELVQKFKGYSAADPRTDNKFWYAKQCSILCCKEIIEVMDAPTVNYPENMFFGKEGQMELIGGKEYWNQVLQHLESL